MMRFTSVLFLDGWITSCSTPQRSSTVHAALLTFIMANLMLNLNPRLPIAQMALYCEEYVGWSLHIRKPEFTYRRVHEESVGLAAYTWFRGYITSVAHLEGTLLIEQPRSAADVTRAIPFMDAIDIIHRGDEYNGLRPNQSLQQYLKKSISP